MKKIEVVNNSVLKAFHSLPKEVQIAFAQSLDMVAFGCDPDLDIDHLTSVGPGVIELKINGHPAYRCVYYNKHPDFVYLLHAFEKTSNGPDKKNTETTRKRYKSIT